VLLLLNDPRIDVAKPKNDGVTPFLAACRAHENGPETFRLLLADSRIDVNIPDNDGNFPIGALAESYGKYSLVEMILASGKKIDATIPRQGADKEAGALLASFNSDRKRVRDRLRNLPHNRKYFAGFLFAAVVLFADEYVKMKDNDCFPEAKRFFTISASLPLELQMVLCNRLFGSGKDLVKSVDSEPGFRSLLTGSPL